MRKKRRLKGQKGFFTALVSALIGCSLFIAGCATVYNPATGKKEYLMINTQEEVALGNQVAVEIERKFVLSRNPAEIERVHRIGAKIAAVSDRRDITYYFKVIQDDDINALSTPGGYIYVNTGLLKAADDDELAAVIAHEVGHVAARHAVFLMQSNMTTSLIGSIIFSNVEASEDVRRGTSAAVNLIMLGYSREDEFEADKLGVRYVYYAGFDADGMAAFLEKLQRQNKENPLDRGLVYLRSHPLYSDRIAKARAQAAYLQEVGRR